MLIFHSLLRCLATYIAVTKVGIANIDRMIKCVHKLRYVNMSLSLGRAKF